VPEVGKIKQKFLKTLPRGAMRHSRSTDFRLDSLAGGLEESGHLFEESGHLFEENGSLFVENGPLFEADVAHDELKEVDGLVEDIAEEIRDLHNLNQTEAEVGCKLDRDNVICSNDVISDKRKWETSRTTIKHQIQRLRAQLNELKQIRKYLRVRRPSVTQRRGHARVLPLDLRAYSGVDVHAHQDAEICACDPSARKAAERRILRAERMRLREEKKLEKLRRKEAKRLKLERKQRRRLNPKKEDHCKADVKMNCFSHDNQHWKTAPLWTEGPFCACTNSNNNTYWCVRNVNSTHNYLYCEYVTGMVTYFDIRVDPHQLRNVLHTLTHDEVNYMHTQVIELRESGGRQTFLEQRRRSEPRTLRLEKRRGGAEKRRLEMRRIGSEKRRALVARKLQEKGRRRKWNRSILRRG